MIIKERTAKRLVSKGKATIEDCYTTDDNGRRYRLVTRHDVIRTDHYESAADKASRAMRHVYGRGTY